MPLKLMPGLWTEERHQNLEDLLIGFWAQGEWDMAECPLVPAANFPEGTMFQKLKFDCVSPSINIELKYACWQKFERGEWSLKTQTHQVLVRRIIAWLNHIHSSGTSILELNNKSGKRSLRCFLEKNGWLRNVTKPHLNKDMNIVRHKNPDQHFCAFRQIINMLNEFYDDRPEYEKNRWNIKKMGFSSSQVKAEVTLNFESISQPWMLEATKKFIFYHGMQYSGEDCLHKLYILREFSAYLAENYPSIHPSSFDRDLIIKFLGKLKERGLSSASIHKILGGIRYFIELSSREKWAEFPERPLIYKEDFPRIPKPLPRFIPQDVLDQLNENLDGLPIIYARMTLLVQECGMRVSELCSLQFNCLRQDADGDWFILYYIRKMKKDHMVPISKEIAIIIQQQQEDVRAESGNDNVYLFPHPNSQKRPIQRHMYVRALNRLSYERRICDNTGKLYCFGIHQFRHTLGTQMINNGVPQHIVQRILGHETADMTNRYAHIFDSTLKQEFIKFKGKTVNVYGQVIERTEGAYDSEDSQWLKQQIHAQALPNGSCALPSNLNKCPHANACHTCIHFRTDARFLPQHEAQLEQTRSIIKTARTNGWERQVEMNEQVELNLSKIIESLKQTYIDE